MRVSTEKKNRTSSPHSTYRYGTIELEHGLSDEEDKYAEDEFELDNTHTHNSHGFPANKRWSVLDKLDKQYSRRDGSCISCMRNITSRCVFATVMLVAFFVLAWYFTRTLIFNIQINPDIYDFIVVGGGSAGSVVARRLLDEGASVLVLESGPHIPYVIEDNGDQIPPTFGSTISEFDIPLLWSSVAENPEVHFGPFNALNVRAFHGLGGGGMHSALLYIRALSTDILSWNVPSFDWDSMLSAYVQLERYQYTSRSLKSPTDPKEGLTSAVPSLFRGTQGPLPTQAPGCVDSFGKSFLSVALQQGERFVHGFNGPEARTGVGCFEVTVEHGVRASPAKALLHEYIVSSRKQRLTLHTGATVHRVLLDKIQSSGLSIGIISQRKRDKHNSHAAPAIYRAVGVEYTLNGENKFAYLSTGPSRQKGAFARDFESLRCVVLTAGAIHTPKLLMNSGVGPADELRAAGVEVKVDSPNVGKNLQDHIAVGLTFQTEDSIGSDYGNAYAFPQQWSSYTRAVHRALTSSSLSSSGSSAGRGNTGTGRLNRYSHATVDAALGSTAEDSAADDIDADFGLLGSNGVSAGAFLASPYAVNATIPDIQVTLYPAVTEPHFLSLMQHKRRNEFANSSVHNEINNALSYRNQMLITVALLSPDAQFQVTLNDTHPLYGTPSVSADLSSGEAADSGGDDQKKLGSAKNHKKRFNPSGIIHPTKDGSVSACGNAYNIVPAALSERDVRRLAWAVERVRRIVRDMQVQGRAVSEVIPINSIRYNDPSTMDGSEVDEEERSRDLLVWVRENAFFQSNWVGSAVLGPSKSTEHAKEQTVREFAARPDDVDNGGDGDDGDDDADDAVQDPAASPRMNQQRGSSVVDEKLNVRNVLSLRVADASVIPRPTSGNVQATVMAVAWRAADFILKTFE